MPFGLMEVRRPYLDQMGDAQRMPSRLDDASRALLAAVATPEGPLQSHVDQWVEAALEIGRLDERRAQLVTQRSTGQEASPGEAYAVKLSWMRVTRSVRGGSRRFPSHHQRDRPRAPQHHCGDGDPPVQGPRHLCRDVDTVVLLAELATVITVLGNGDDRTASTLALAAHMPRDTASPYLGLVAPVDSLRRELDFALAAGARFALPE
jgi:hypothetical protein